jgi:hypothetical protein
VRLRVYFNQNQNAQAEACATGTNPPIPASKKVCALIFAMSEIFNVPVSRPFDFGSNCTPIVQLAVAVAASEPVHVFDESRKFR